MWDIIAFYVSILQSAPFTVQGEYVKENPIKTQTVPICKQHISASNTAATPQGTHILDYTESEQ